MMTRLLPALWVSLLCLIGSASQAATTVNKLTILAYHEIAEKNEALEPEYTVTPGNFAHQMEWLKKNGYHFVGVDDLLADRQGKAPLPPKAVLLTFDDGYRSVYLHAFPILKQLQAPAVIALVGQWLEPPKGDILFAGKSVPRADMLKWSDIEEMTRSGLVEVANHSYDLHHGLQANPQGNQEPTATTRRYLPELQRYEDEAHYRQRLLADLSQNNALLRQRLGVRPRVMIWPYGRYNSTTSQIASQLGMPIQMTLDDGANLATTPLSALRRVLVDADTSLDDFRKELGQREANASDNDHAVKAMSVDLDNIYDPDPAEQERKLGALLERIVALKVNTVYLKAFADPDQTGVASAVYFPNRHLPMRADLFNRAAWQIRTRTEVKRLYAWMPMLAFELPKQNAAAGDKISLLPGATPQAGKPAAMLSPFSPRAQRTIREVYQDLARYSTFEGLLFNDESPLAEYADRGPYGRKTYKAWRTALPQGGRLPERWTLRNLRAEERFASSLVTVVQNEQPELSTARRFGVNFTDPAHIDPQTLSELEESLSEYNFVTLHMEGGKGLAANWQALAHALQNKPGTDRKVVLELPLDASGAATVPANTPAALYGAGIRHISYGPDNSTQTARGAASPNKG